MPYPTKKLGEVFEPIFTEVEKNVLARIADGDKQEEYHITGDIFTRIEERMNNRDFNGLRVRTPQFSVELLIQMNH